MDDFVHDTNYTVHGFWKHEISSQFFPVYEDEGPMFGVRCFAQRLSAIFKENSKRPLAADTDRFSFLAAYKATDMAKY